MFVEDGTTEIIISHGDPLFIRSVWNYLEHKWQFLITDDLNHMIVTTEITIDGRKVTPA